METPDMHADVRRRARTALAAVVEPAIFGPGRAVGTAAHHVRGEPIPYTAALNRPFEPFAPGEAWGPAWDTTWFRVCGTIPEEWAGEEVVLRFEHSRRGGAGPLPGPPRTPGPGAESLAWIGGVPVQGLSPNHREVLLAPDAAGGEAVEVYIESAANPTTPEDRMVGFDWPVLRPEPAGEPVFVLARCELAVRHREVDALAADLRTAVGLAEHRPGDIELHAALHAACAALDGGDVIAAAPRARAGLAAVLSRTNGEASHRVTAVGHAHIDTAWLWPLRETVRKCARTFATAVTLMEAYPEYHFVCSAAQHLAWVEEHYPELFRRIAERVATGQFEVVGAMWVEADCNLASGESLVRQILHGTAWFESRFGARSGELWLPDAFGYTAALPQIMSEAGIRWFVSQKLSWNEVNRFPHYTFWWEGIDGTRVRAHFPPANTYNGDMSMPELFRGAGTGPRSLYPYGHGDGGGGPTREMIESARRSADLAGAPRVALEPARAFFAASEADPAPLPVWAGELYLEKHRGTYTSQAGIKRGNRRAEAALSAAELWCAAAAASGPPAAPPWPGAELDRAWKLLLTNQFHDILPGSSIRWVAEEAEAMLSEATRIADGLAATAMAAIARDVDTSGLEDPVVVFNSTGVARREVVEHGGHRFVAEVPPLGYAAVDVAAGGVSATAVRVGGRSMSNGQLRVSWDAGGALTSIWDAAAGREVLAPGRRGNVFQLHEDRPADYDAWDVDRSYLDAVTELAGPVDIDVVDAGGLRGAVRFRRRFGGSSIDQTMVLDAGSRRIDFVTDVDWQEDHAFLKVAFPVAVHSPRATFEIQFGHLERPTHENTSWDWARFEVWAQRWADLSEAGYGVALLNDCKYGYDVRGNVLRLSLLRAPTAPDPLCDRGRHRFTYSLLPHRGDFRGGDVIPAGYALNSPLVVLGPPRAGGAATRPRTHSFAAVDDPGFVTETVKRADSGDGVVLRGYEAFGGRRRVSLRPGVRFSRAVRCDLFEEAKFDLPVEDGCVILALRPFELVTLRLLP